MRSPTIDRPRPAAAAGRAVLPVDTGVVRSADGVEIAYEIFGSGSPPLVFLPSAPIIHSRQWKGQVPDFSRRHRVVTYDGRGNGRSGRPTEPEAFHDDRFLDDLIAVLDATQSDRAVLVGLCTDGVWRAIRLAAERPERVIGIVAFAAGVPRLTPPQPHYAEFAPRFHEVVDAYDGWAKFNAHHWRRDYRDWIEFFFGQMIREPHSTKALEDVVAWAMDVSLDSILAENETDFPFSTEHVEAACRKVHCPMLIVHGSDDQCQLPARAKRLAEITGAPLVVIEGAGHLIPARHPVVANLLIRSFIDSLPGGNP